MREDAAVRHRAETAKLLKEIGRLRAALAKISGGPCTCPPAGPNTCPAHVATAAVRRYGGDVDRVPSG